jgi:hypothetical protein
MKTCKSLRDILADKYVWFYALRDIMTAVTMPDLNDADLALTSTEELKRRAVLATRVDLQWRKATVTLQSARHLCADDVHARVAKAKFLPGGEWLVLLLHDGTLCLQGSTSTVPCVVDPDFKTRNPDVRMNLSLSAKNDTLVLLRTWHWDTRCVPSSHAALV